MANFEPTWFSGSADEQYNALKNNKLFDADGFDFAEHERNIDAYNKANNKTKHYIDSFYEQPEIINLTRKDVRPTFKKGTDAENFYDNERLEILSALESGREYKPRNAGEGISWWIINKMRHSSLNDIKNEYETALKGLDEPARAKFFADEREKINTRELKALAKDIAGGAAAYYQGAWDFLGVDNQKSDRERKETNELIQKRFKELGVRGYLDLDSGKWFVQPAEFIGTSQWLSFEPHALGGFVDGLKANAGKTVGAIVGGLGTTAALKRFPLTAPLANTPAGERATNLVGGVVGSAIGSALGGIVDNQVGASKAGIENANITKNIVGDAALGAGGEVVGRLGLGLVAGGLRQARRLPIVSVVPRSIEFVKNAIKNENIGAVESMAKQLMTPEALTAASTKPQIKLTTAAPTAAADSQASLIPQGARDFFREVLDSKLTNEAKVLNTATSDSRGHFAAVVGNAVKGDVKGLAGLKELNERVAGKFIDDVIAPRGANADEVASLLAKKQADVRAAYRAGLDEISSSATPVPVNADELTAQTTQILKEIQGGRTDEFIKEAAHVADLATKHLSKNGETTFAKLDGLRQDLNKFYTNGDDVTRRFIAIYRNEVLNPLIEKSLAPESLAKYQGLLKEYGETAGVTHFDEVVKLMSDDTGAKSFKTAVGKILETGEKENGKLARIQNVLSGDELAKFEETLVREIADKYIVVKDGIRSFNSGGMLDKVSELGFTPKTAAAQDFLKQIADFNVENGGFFHIMKSAGAIPQIKNSVNNQISDSPWQRFQTMLARRTAERIVANIPQDSILFSVLGKLGDESAAMATNKISAAAFGRSAILPGEAVLSPTTTAAAGGANSNLLRSRADALARFMRRAALTGDVAKRAVNYGVAGAIGADNQAQSYRGAQLNARDKK